MLLARLSVSVSTSAAVNGVARFSSVWRSAFTPKIASITPPAWLGQFAVLGAHLFLDLRDDSITLALSAMDEQPARILSHMPADDQHPERTDCTQTACQSPAERGIDFRRVQQRGRE